MNLLFYYPSNKRSNALETLIEGFCERKINVIVLTTCERGEFHYYLESKGIKTYTNNVHNKSRFVYYVKQISFLRSFCKEYKIDTVHSHLQQANIISVLAQAILKPKVIVFRHHFQFNVYSNDSSLQRNRIESFFDRLINRLAKVIVVPSTGVYKGMIEHEKVRIEKLRIIPYVYDFKKYANPNEKVVEEIKAMYKSKLLLLMCSRLIKFKRHLMVFKIVNELTKEGLDIKMIVLDEGPEKKELEDFISAGKLQDRIFMLGFKSNFVDYMAAADLMIHPSLTEASNSAVKEMGILGKPVAVCDGVGDFSDYIENGVNSYLLPTNDTEIYLKKLLREIYANKNELKIVGSKLKGTVHSKFDRSEKILNMYLELTR
jgi:glycosyltransferase involved in cell wall biosynthesis